MAENIASSASVSYVGSLLTNTGAYLVITNFQKLRMMAFRPASYEYDWFFVVIAEIFNVNVEWLEQIRQQTEPQPLDLSQGMFPIYFKP